MDYIEIVHDYSFLDYVLNGTELKLVVGIDFTSSNLEIEDPRSLHYNNPNVRNKYETAMAEVGAILINYVKE